MGYRFYPPYVTVAKKKAKAAKKLKQLKKKNPDIKPILLEGRTLAGTWWGKSWNSNLERYADYSNRIGRGRSYVRHGAVLDLKIDKGVVESLVQGSRSKPYSVSIKIKAINKKIWQSIKAACEGKMDSLHELLAGKFPRTLGEIFTVQGKGLFPSPGEIEFSCSCPDWAYMCKHVAATLYGIGARLDEDPVLFFKLRKVKMKDLITQAVEDETRKLLKKARKKTERIIAESDIADVFGIEMEDTVVPGKKKSLKTPGKKSGKRKSSPAKKKKGTRSRKTKSPTQKKTAAKRTVSKTGVKKPPFDTVVGIIRRSKKGVTVTAIKEKTGLEVKQIRNCIYRAKNQGKIKNKERGVYVSS